METNPTPMGSTSGMSSSDMSTGMPTGVSSAGMDTSQVHGTVDRAARAAHDTVDRLASQAGPAMERMRAMAADAQERMRQKYGDLGAMEEEWVTMARTCVRDHPLASVAVAVVAGMLISRMSSSSSRHH